MKKLIFTVGLCFIVSLAYAQQEAHYTQFIFNKLAFNPAYAGSKDVASASLLYRKQWVGIEGAPEVQTFNFHAPFFKKRVGVGLSVLHDKIGVTDNWFVNLSYAYRMKIGKTGTLAVGVQGNVTNVSVDWNQTEAVQIGDAAIPIGQPSALRANIGTGLYYNNDKFYGHRFADI